MSSSPVQEYAILNEVKLKLNISTSDVSQDVQITVATNDANNYIAEQTAVHATVIVAGEDPSLTSMANNLAAAYFNFWLSTEKDREELERWQNRIQQYIMAKYGKKSANLLSGEETIGVTRGFVSSTGSVSASTFSSPLTTKGDLFGFSTVNARIPVGADGFILTADSGDGLGVSWQMVGSGTGDVVGPSSGATDNAIVRFDTITGKLIKNSGVLIDDSDNVTGVTSIAIGDATWIISEDVSDELLFTSPIGDGSHGIKVVSDTGEILLQNTVSTNDYTSILSTGFTNASSATSAIAFSIQSNITTASDTGTEPITQIQGKANGGAVTTRPIIGFYNFNTKLLEIDNDGTADFQGNTITNAVLELTLTDGSIFIGDQNNVATDVPTGLEKKINCRVASTVNIDLTGEAVSSVDGVSISANDRILLKNQTTSSENGIYDTSILPSNSVNWFRATDADTSIEVNNGMFTVITEGTINANTAFVLSTPDPITLGVTNLTFQKFSFTDITNLNAIQRFTGIKTFGSAGDVGKLAIAGSTSGITVLDATSIASGTLTLPAATDVLVARDTIDTLTNKTIDANNNTLSNLVIGAEVTGASTALTDSAVIARSTNNLSFFSATTSSQLAGVISDETGTGLLVFGTSPTIVTPTIASFVNATHDHEDASGGGQLLSTSALSDTANIAYLNTANTYTAGVRQDFLGDTSGTAGINLGGIAGNPTTQVDGDVWLNTSTNQIFGRINGVNVDFGATGGEVFLWTADHSMTTFKLTATTANDVIFNAPTAQGVSIEVAGIEEYLFNATVADFNENNVINMGTLTFANQGSGGDVTLSVNSDDDTLSLSGGLTMTFPGSPINMLENKIIFASEQQRISSTFTGLMLDYSESILFETLESNSSVTFKSTADTASDFANLDFDALNDDTPIAGELVYASIVATINDPTTGSEDGAWKFQVISNGTPSTNLLGMNIDGDSAIKIFDNLRFNNPSGDDPILFANNTLQQLDLTGSFSISSFEQFAEISIPGNPAANFGKFYAKESGGVSVPFWLDEAGTEFNLLAGSQTPWLTDIDAAGNDLTGLSNIEFGTTTGAPLGTAQAIYADAGGIIFNVPTSDEFLFKINDVGEYSFNATTADFNNNSITNALIDGDLNTISDINETQQTVSSGVSGTILTSNGAGSPPTYQAQAGGGDVSGPISATDNAVVRFDLTTGKQIKNGVITIDDDANMELIRSLLFTSHTSGPGSSTTHIALVDTDFHINTTTGNNIQFLIEGVTQYQFDATSANFNGNNLLMGAAFTQYTAIGSPGVTGSSLVGRLFLDTGNSSHLSIIRNTSVIDLEEIPFPINFPEQPAANATASQEINFSGNDRHAQKYTLTTNTTFTFAGTTTDTTEYIDLLLVQDATGGFTIDLGSAVNAAEVAAGIDLTALAETSILVKFHYGTVYVFLQSATGSGITSLNGDIEAVQTLTGGTGIDITDSSPDHSFAIDSTVVTLTDTQILTNKTIDANNNTLSNLVIGAEVTGASTALTDTADIARSTNNLSFFSATTSSQLAGVISDETGTGLLVFGTSPTIVTPTIASFVNATHDHTNAAGGGQLLSTSALSDTANIAYLNTANTYTAGVRQDFLGDTSGTAGINVGGISGNPTTQTNGDVWLNTSTNQIFGRINGVNVDFGATGGGITSLNGDTVAVQTLTGGTGIDITDSTPDHSFAIDSTVVTLTDTQILTNKTLTAPQITSASSINDANGNELILFPTVVASAVNEITISNATTTNAVQIQATGDDTDVDVRFVPKGAGTFYGNRETWSWPLTDETTLPTTGVKFTTEPAPYDMAIEDAISGLTDAGNGAALWTIDVLKEDSVNADSFTTIFSTLPTIDASEFTSTTAATAPVISVSTWEKGTRLQLSISTLDTDGLARGSKVSLLTHATAK